MTEQQFKVIATENVKQMINCMASKDFSKLPAITNIEGYWCKDGETQLDAILSFGEWLTEQLDMWSEDEGREFALEAFQESCLELDDFEEGDDQGFGEYNPKSHGEPLDLWFELKFTIDAQDTLTSEFNINI